MVRMQVSGCRRFERTELVLLPFDFHVVDTDGFDPDLLDVGSKIIEVADGVRLDHLSGRTVKKDRITGIEVNRH
nr:hypothetical protein [Halomarina salina]